MSDTGFSPQLETRERQLQATPPQVQQATPTDRITPIDRLSSQLSLSSEMLSSRSLDATVLAPIVPDIYPPPTQSDRLQSSPTSDLPPTLPPRQVRSRPSTTSLTTPISIALRTSVTTPLSTAQPLAASPPNSSNDRMNNKFSHAPPLPMTG